ncbi:hypothetical protein F4803DRAFT_466488 [Xylaria telfairii]|nr:hypothetical protein F4803DRAFT_466488 [Xylaria telfairii]
MNNMMSNFFTDRIRNQATSDAATSNQRDVNNSVALSTSPSTHRPSPSPTTSSAVLLFPDGIKVWTNPPDATIDVCFVHGLTGDRDATWTAAGQLELWPPILLPGRLPKARPLTYGYDAYVVRNSVATSNTLNDHATNLLRDLTDDLSKEVVYECRIQLD